MKMSECLTMFCILFHKKQCLCPALFLWVTIDDCPTGGSELTCCTDLEVNKLTFKGKRQLGMNMLACLISTCVHVGFPSSDRERQKSFHFLSCCSNGCSGLQKSC